MQNKTGQGRRVSIRSPFAGVRGGAAFTLVELIVVLLIIGLLMAVIVPATHYAIRLGVAARAQTRVDKLANAAEAYKLEKGHYPGWRDTAQLSTGTYAADKYTGSQMLAAIAFGYPYTDIGCAANPTSDYCTYEEDETLFTFDEGGSGERQHTLSDGFWITTMAICYYVSWPGEAGMDQFKEADNNEYTEDHIATDADFATFITSNYGLPYNDGTFLLISAGPDREFFSNDDATNWKK